MTNKNSSAHGKETEEKKLNYADYTNTEELMKAILQESSKTLQAKQSLIDLLGRDEFKDKARFDGACKTIAFAFRMTQKEVISVWQELHGLEKSEDDEQEAKSFEYDIDPCPEEVKPYDLIIDLKEELKKYIVFQEYEIEDAQALTCSLWVLSNWFIDSFKYCPYLIITAPTPRCGKSQLLNLLGKLSRRSLPASNMSASILFRSIKKYKRPTIFIDEVDTFLSRDGELQGLINAGIEKGEALAWRNKTLSNGDFEPEWFDTFAFKALSGISAESISSTIADRSITIRLARKFSSDIRPKVRDQSPEHWQEFQRRCARVAIDWKEWVKDYKFEDRPELDDDRALDVWQPLLTISDLIDYVAEQDGDLCNFGQKVRQIAELLTKEDEADPYFGIELLSNIKELFSDDYSFIGTKRLLELLNGNEEWKWSTYGRGDKPLSANSLSSLLKQFKIKAKKPTSGDRHRGYYRKDFKEAFDRYLKQEERQDLE